MAEEVREKPYLWGKFVIETAVAARTGLHIGGSPAALEVGGVDNTVVKDARGVPYIPGSSLKGKLRSLLERLDRCPAEYRIANGFIHVCTTQEAYERCWVCRIFGVPAQAFNGPTRLIVRDAPLQEESLTDAMRRQLDLPYTEIKWENSLDRLTSAANPRQLERVPAGARFSGVLVLSLYEGDGPEFLRRVLQAMQLLEHDALGGSGSRGSGQVAFEDLAIRWYSRDDYLHGRVGPERPPLNPDAPTVSQVLARFDALAQALA